MPKCETDAKRVRVNANAAQPGARAVSARGVNAKREALVISVGRLFYFRTVSVSLWYNAGAPSMRTASALLMPFRLISADFCLPKSSDG